MSSPIAYIVGATGALGRVASRMFDEAGWRLALGARSQRDLDRLVSTLRSPERSVPIPPDTGTGACPSPSATALDASDPDAVQAALDHWEREIGAPDACLHLAGGYLGGKEVSDWTFEEWDSMYRTNLLGPSLVLSGVFGRMVRASKRGSLLAIGAVAGIEAPPRKIPYGVSKAGLLHFMNGLADEGKVHGIRANLVVPVVLDTEANRAMMPRADFSKWTSLEAAARVLLWLASNDSTPVSGSIVRI